LVGYIPKRLAQLIDRCIQAVFEVTRGRAGPKAVAKILTRYQFARPIRQRIQNRAGLRSQSDSGSMFEQFSRARIKFEGAEGELRWSGMLGEHLSSGVFDLTTR